MLVFAQEVTYNILFYFYVGRLKCHSSTNLQDQDGS